MSTSSSLNSLSRDCPSANGSKAGTPFQQQKQKLQRGTGVIHRPFEDHGDGATTRRGADQHNRRKSATSSPVMFDAAADVDRRGSIVDVSQMMRRQMAVAAATAAAAAASGGINGYHPHQALQHRGMATEMHQLMPTSPSSSSQLLFHHHQQHQQQHQHQQTAAQLQHFQQLLLQQQLLQQRQRGPVAFGVHHGIRCSTTAGTSDLLLQQMQAAAAAAGSVELNRATAAGMSARLRGGDGGIEDGDLLNDEDDVDELESVDGGGSDEHGVESACDGRQRVGGNDVIDENGRERRVDELMMMIESSSSSTAAAAASQHPQQHQDHLQQQQQRSHQHNKPTQPC